MNDVLLVEKRCTKCGETKPLSTFYRDRKRPDGHSGWCKPCDLASVRASQERRRQAMGDEAWRAYQAASTARSRQRTGNAVGKEYARAEHRAVQALKSAHTAEFEHLLLLARRGELPPTSPIKDIP